MNKMKLLNTLLTVTLLSTALCVSATTSQLNVTFKHIEKNEGNLMVALYNSKANYKGEGSPVQYASVPASAQKVSYTFKDLEKGTYAIKLFHDVNNNGKMDTNMFGIPQEGYGFSNNVGKFGEPDFIDAAFAVDGISAIEIIVR
jgi:uncharacterized protein (DUF2141 family)